ncbi:MAG: FtsX-like permease family protein [Planctomycetales bacterium]|nr:FtsX-like permease family protein [Planctomycetales bacterium]
MLEIAIKTLISDRGKLFTALSGVVFAFVLANVQGGLYLGLVQKASLLVDNSGADIWVGHYKMHNAEITKVIPTKWIDRVRSVPGVAEAEPYLLSPGVISLPSGGFEEVVLVGVDSNSLLGNAWNVTQGLATDVRQRDAIIIDEYDESKLEHPQIGDVYEIGDRRARVVAKSKGILGFMFSPYVFTTFERAAEYAGRSPDYCSYYLVKTIANADPQAVCRAIEANVPDVYARTKEDYSDISVNYWITRTGIGISFGIATVLGLFIGLIMVANTLYAMALDRIEEFATLKAIGCPEVKVCSVLILQSLVVAILGSVVGAAIVFLIQHFGSTPKTPIIVPATLAAATAVLVFVICLVSAFLPYIKVRRVDPIMVLR